MKKYLLGLGLAAAIALPAQAVTMRAGDFEIHLKDATSLYVDHDNNPATPKIPRPPNFAADVGLSPAPGFNPALYAASSEPQIGDESRSITQLDQIAYAIPPNVDLPTGTILGISQDLIVGPPVLIVPGVVTIGTFTTDGSAFLRLYLDPTPNDFDGNGTVNQNDVFNPLGDGNAPTHWVEDALGPGIDGFPNINLPIPVNPGDEEDAVLWLELQYLANDGANNPLDTGTVLVETVFPTLGSSSSTDAFLHITGGVAANQFEKGIYGTTPGGLTADLILAYTQRFPPNLGYDVVDNYAYMGSWQLESSDPIQGRGFLIPEPATISLFGLGIASLLGYRRRQK